MFKKSLILFAAVLVVFIIVLSGCNNKTINQEPPVAEESPVMGGSINIGLTSKIESLNPLMTQNKENEELINLVFDGLVKPDENLLFQPAIARKWEVSENGLDWTFYLRDDVYWHDGFHLTSQDVIFTFDKVFAEGENSTWKEKMSNIANYYAFDEKTIKIELYQPDASFLSIMTIKILPQHLLETGEENSGKLEEAFSQKPVGTGPYKIQNWDHQKNIIELTANDNYYLKRPYIDKIIFKTYEDIDSLRNAFDSGEIDILTIEPSDWALYQEKEKVEIYEYPRLYYDFMALNLSGKPAFFKDINLRKALIYGIQREKILQEVLLGRGFTINSPIPSISWAFNPNLIEYRFQPEKAAELLKQSGWSDTDNNGILDKNGIQLEFELLVNEENQNRYLTALQIKEDLKKLGINVKIRLKPWLQVKKQIMSHNFEAALLGWELKPDPDLEYAFSSKKIRDGLNFVSYKNPEIDRITAKARITVDINKRKALLFKAQEIINDELPYIFLFTHSRLLAANEKIKGIIPSPNGYLWGIENWWIPQKYQNTNGNS
ncbi:MAG: peptide/nickel transport system substrate-binding protein [Thermosediminibacterales bacterium]|nr:peptide/nickel transport system substrate-binding protein [Thermosediminibacterales bacterium]MDK2835278.1 peptide/nickel transport system substrate-binding protein [Thermosediminibacterales bacterium]